MPVCKRTGAPVNPTVAPCIQNLAKICYAASGVLERDLFCDYIEFCGEVSEWLKEHAWKVCKG